MAANKYLIKHLIDMLRDDGNILPRRPPPLSQWQMRHVVKYPRRYAGFAGAAVQIVIWGDRSQDFYAG